MVRIHLGAPTFSRSYMTPTAPLLMKISTEQAPWRQSAFRWNTPADCWPRHVNPRLAIWRLRGWLVVPRPTAIGSHTSDKTAPCHRRPLYWLGVFVPLRKLNRSPCSAPAPDGHTRGRRIREIYAAWLIFRFAASATASIGCSRRASPISSRAGPSLNAERAARPSKSRRVRRMR